MHHEPDGSRACKNQNIAILQVQVEVDAPQKNCLVSYRMCVKNVYKDVKQVVMVDAHLAVQVAVTQDVIHIIKYIVKEVM